jgi:hypothetical protein
VPALHEAFADIVAMFQRLTFSEVVAPAIRETRGNLLDSSPKNRLLDIGAQFGSASGKGGPLRRIAGKPDPTLFARTKEPHALGWILVSAVYEGFVSTYERRTRDLLRLSTGGSGRLPEGELHPDLVNRLTWEAVRTAQSVLSMCIRATDYLPPVDPTFSDFLRAMVTADFELNRADDSGIRADMIEAFRQRGIRPEAVGSLAVPALLLEPEDLTATKPNTALADIVSKLLEFGARQLNRNYSPSPAEKGERKRRPPRKIARPSDFFMQQNMPVDLSDETKDAAVVVSPEDEPEDVLRDVSTGLHAWANTKENRERLRLDPDLPVAVRGSHPVHRIAASGELLVEMVAHFVQTQRTADDLGGLEYRAGVTVIANIDGHVRYIIPKPFHGARQKRLRDWVTAFDDANEPGWVADKRDPNRVRLAYSARAMDRRRWR